MLARPVHRSSCCSSILQTHSLNSSTYPNLQTDPLSSLLTKYIPSTQRPYRDIEGRYEGLDITQLVKAGSWRALARLSRDVIVSSSPENIDLIFEVRRFVYMFGRSFVSSTKRERSTNQMHHLRQLSLLSLHLHSQHVHELQLLFTVISHLPGSLRASLPIPFSLELMQAKTKGVDELTRLLRKCRDRCKRGGAESTMWKERVSWAGSVLAGTLIEQGVRRIYLNRHPLILIACSHCVWIN